MKREASEGVILSVRGSVVDARFPAGRLRPSATF